MKSKRNNPIKTAKHHWWPGSLSKAWARGDGCVTQLRWDGEETSGDPYRFGFSKNTHHLKPGGDGGSLWDTSFEGDFQRADDAFPDLALWLSKLKVKRPKSAALSERLLAQPLPKDWRATLSECLASLIVRSPCTRNQIRALIEPARAGLPDPSASKSLLAANLVRTQGAFTRAIASSGKFVALIADSNEFVFGDGFLHNFSIPPDHIWGRRCMVPMLPTVSILFVQPPAGLSPAEPQLTTILLTNNEVNIINDVTQIYSCDQLFYRNKRPRLIEPFTRHEFLELANDPLFLADLVHSVAHRL